MDLSETNSSYPSRRSIDMTPDPSTDGLTLDEFLASAPFEALTRLFWLPEHVHALLDDIGYATNERTPYAPPMTSVGYWTLVCQKIHSGGPLEPVDPEVRPGPDRLQFLLDAALGLHAALKLSSDDKQLFPGPPVPDWKLREALSSEAYEALARNAEFVRVLRGLVSLDQMALSQDDGWVTRFSWEYDLIHQLARALRGRGQRIHPRVDDCYRQVCGRMWAEDVRDRGPPTPLGYAWRLIENEVSARNPRSLLLLFVRGLRQIFPTRAEFLREWENQALQRLS
jgi:hypothetical protein